MQCVHHKTGLSYKALLKFMKNMTTSPYFLDCKRFTRSAALINVQQESVRPVNSSANDVPKVKPRKRTIKKEKVDISYEENNKQSVKVEPNEIDLKKIKQEPPLWREQLQNIKEMRKYADAPVDSMGCDVISDDRATPEVYRYQVLISLMLSSQTKDQVTSAAMAKLRAHGCNIPNILKTPDTKLGELIYPVGFWKRKVEYIKKTSQILEDKYKSDIPDSVEALLSLV